MASKSSVWRVLVVGGPMAIVATGLGWTAPSSERPRPVPPPG